MRSPWRAPALSFLSDQILTLILPIVARCHVRLPVTGGVAPIVRQQCVPVVLVLSVLPHPRHLSMPRCPNSRKAVRLTWHPRVVILQSHGILVVRGWWVLGESHVYPWKNTTFWTLRVRRYWVHKQLTRCTLKRLLLEDEVERKHRRGGSSWWPNLNAREMNTELDWEPREDQQLFMCLRTRPDSCFVSMEEPNSNPDKLKCRSNIVESWKPPGQEEDGNNAASRKK